MFTRPPGVEASFWAHERYQEAFRTRHFGWLIQAFRADPRFAEIYGPLGINQSMMADWLGSSQSQLSRVETGPAPQQLDLLSKWASTLNVPESMLWFDLPGRRRPGLPATQDGRDTLRRMEDTIMDAAEESARLLAWTEVDAIGDLTIDQINDDIRWIAANYLKAPTPPLFDRARALRDRVFELLPRCKSPARLLELYSAAGWSLSLLGWMSVDIGSPHAALGHLRAAWACAGHAANDELKAWVRACQHTAYFWSDDFHQAAWHAEDGLRHAERGTARLFLSSALALDTARSRETSRAKAALDEAHRAAECGPSGPDALAGPFTCTTARATGFWSDVYLSLDRADTALDDANRAVRLFERTAAPVRNLGSERMARCQVVKAQLALGNPDGALEALVPILTTEPEKRARPLLRRVSEIAELALALDRPNAPPVREIHDAIVEFDKQSAATQTRPQILTESGDRRE